MAKRPADQDGVDRKIRNRALSASDQRHDIDIVVNQNASVFAELPITPTGGTTELLTLPSLMLQPPTDQAWTAAHRLLAHQEAETKLETSTKDIETYRLQTKDALADLAHAKTRFSDLEARIDIDHNEKIEQLGRARMMDHVLTELPSGTETSITSIPLDDPDAQLIVERIQDNTFGHVYHHMPRGSKWRYIGNSVDHLLAGAQLRPAHGAETAAVIHAVKSRVARLGDGIAYINTPVIPLKPGDMITVPFELLEDINADLIISGHSCVDVLSAPLHSTEKRFFQSVASMRFPPAKLIVQKISKVVNPSTQAAFLARRRFVSARPFNNTGWSQPGALPGTTPLPGKIDFVVDIRHASTTNGAATASFTSDHSKFAIPAPAHDGDAAGPWRHVDNTVLAFHGCSTAAAADICANGFKSCYLRNPDTQPPCMFGCGHYFAQDATKALIYAGPQQAGDPPSAQRLVVAALPLGQTCYATKPLQNITQPPGGKDSVVAITTARAGSVEYREFILFNEAAYPAYLVDLKHDDSCMCAHCDR